VNDTTLAVVKGQIAGFLMVVDNEVEQLYVSALHRGEGVICEGSLDQRFESARRLEK
jgi:hypothetical protein